ncbi:hypothetical protein K2F54_14020 [Cryobacterium sp. 1639]|uniref:hypothetical protein n=1 Tax=Cryobacterium inferilacus TaxID=2866629 RepID=UPI001C73813E|nr:hypothetical protein [Cryobacterium sp. 1639]MBX0301087.1 hypothetical protein [Cryobacterium sp. 1639]
MAHEIAPVATANTGAPRYSGEAVLALLAGLLAVIVPAPFSMLLGGIAMLLAGAAHRELQQINTVRGTVLSLLGFLIGLGSVAVQVAPLLLAYLHVLLASLVP